METNSENWHEYWVIFVRPDAKDDEEVVFTARSDCYENVAKMANQCQLINEGYEIAGIVKAAYISDVGYCLECYAMGIEQEAIAAKQKKRAS